LLKNIIPKLETSLHEFVINPNQQDMSRWQWVMDWKDLLPSATLVAMLEKHFFSKWLQVLASWLNQYPNYTEVTKWYQGWKEEFSNVGGDLLAHQQIRAFLNQALEMMNRAVSGGNPMSMQAGAFESMRYLASCESATAAAPVLMRGTPPQPPPVQMCSSANAQIPESFKDLVAKRCAERGILFAPMPGKVHEGKQVYRCGNCMVYIDRSVIFLQRSGMWLHTSLDNLLSNAL
jgi:tuftelin-interacting protein 11